MGTCNYKCFQHTARGSRQLPVGGQMLTCAIRRSGNRDSDLFLTTSFGFDLLELGRRQVGQRRVRPGG
jgi:hypothetical protein